MDLYVIKRLRKTGDVMTKCAKNIIKGIGSVIDIAPTPKSQKIGHFDFVPDSLASSSKGIEGDWNRVGNNIQISINRLSHAHGKK